MNYDLSEKILSEIKRAKKILVNCHRSPDADSVGSALGLFLVLKSLGKDVKVICPDKVPSDLGFLPHSGEVEKIDFGKFNFGSFDLFIILDSGSVGMVTGKRESVLPDIATIVIDHHTTNGNFGQINLVDEKISSTSEILFLIFEDWGVEIEKDVAQNLLAGIIADTGVFEYPNVTNRTLGIAENLMDKGGKKDEIIFNIFKNVDFGKVKFWGEILARMEKDEAGFVWSAVSHEDFKKFGSPGSAKETAASMFAPVVKDTSFGMIMVEEEKEILSISFRSRGNFDVSAVAEKLGGGGHKSAAGAKVYMPYDAAVIKVLEIARKITNEKKD
jgi:phosphoesterase RecJ-like protein